MAPSAAAAAEPEQPERRENTPSAVPSAAQHSRPPGRAAQSAHGAHGAQGHDHRDDHDAAPQQPLPLVRAAGALCWYRAPDGGLRLLLVHRPRYRDWSWPKGKLEGAELPPAAAVREVAEETGLVIRLGRALPSARYALGADATKEVSYWAAHVEGARHPVPPRPAEVDRTEWVTPEEADARLTRRGDRVQLRALLAADRTGGLDTWPLVVVRHGHAHPKTAWGRSDDERPLAAPGRRQAERLPELLTAWQPPRVVTSPWRRCTDTVEPYLRASGAKVKTRGRLTEDAHRRDPGRTAKLVRKLLGKQRPVLLCTHRPVLSTVFGELAEHAADDVAAAVPQHDPYLGPGEVLVAHVSRSSGLVVAVERHAVPAG
ncbi:NUDIX hydrolase [Quadrisphaera setariae]|uniref:NUDIX hydrolase n=1 Tax=Quadrisphaera setariae TaxID=2593304 RepID=UPI001C9C4B01|nr:NUDIX domain-containing protein [Quadrisphaera setariae]